MDRNVLSRNLSLVWPGSVPNLVRNDFFMCREIIRFKEKSELTSARYSHSVIEWIRDWQPNIQDEILAESLILNNGNFFTNKKFLA